MTPRFPPPDPHEPDWLGPTNAQPIAAPTALFASGPASPEADRIADRVLDIRPGLFIVLAA
jgi:hypothetical protein